ncbi:MAG: glycosyltransferase [Nitrosopumilus sp.]|nr:glycosyltransferase [Nitrosopumilus sp.]
MIDYNFPYYSNISLSILLCIQAIILFAWIYFLIYSIKTIKQVPQLDSHKEFKNNLFPMVSIILPSRNEEKYIGRCLDSLLRQDYLNYEIIAIDDSSSDKTGEIIKKYSNSHSNIIYVDAEPKPDGWTGKNWACHQGYLKSKGNLILFTDADTTHSVSTISLAVAHLTSEELDAITAIPKILAHDFWTKITLPILWTFSLARFSALKANNPKTKVGYFFGSFFVIKRNVYVKVGTHKSVREEIIEDGELGRKVKEHGFRLRVVHGERNINAVWARDASTLWHGLRRLMIPLYKKEKIKATLMVFATFLLLLLPLIIVPLVTIIDSDWKYTAAIINSKTTFSLNTVLLFLTLLCILLIVVTNVLQLKYVLFQNTLYSLFVPFSGTFVFIAFLSSIVSSGKYEAISWRGRKYSIRAKNTQK